jgi:iron complex transport system substrate-binding protein
MAGGRDIFVELREQPTAQGRIVSAQEVARRDPHIILASWCGKPVDVALIAGRPGWQEVAAVKAGLIYEVAGEDILSPGPSLLVGLRRIHEIVQEYQAT